MLITKRVPQPSGGYYPETLGTEQFFVERIGYDPTTPAGERKLLAAGRAAAKRLAHRAVAPCFPFASKGSTAGYIRSFETLNNLVRTDVAFCAPSLNLPESLPDEVTA